MNIAHIARAEYANLKIKLLETKYCSYGTHAHTRTDTRMHARTHALLQLMKTELKKDADDRRDEEKRIKGGTGKKNSTGVRMGLQGE